MFTKCSLSNTSIPSHQVKYWALGNEVWGPWQVEETTKEQYGQKAWQWAKALKLLDPTIQLVLCGESGVSSWDFHVLNACVKNQFGLAGMDVGGGIEGTAVAAAQQEGVGRKRLIDMCAIHMYTASEVHVQNAFGEFVVLHLIVALHSSFVELIRPVQATKTTN